MKCLIYILYSLLHANEFFLFSLSFALTRMHAQKHTRTHTHTHTHTHTQAYIYSQTWLMDLRKKMISTIQALLLYAMTNTLLSDLFFLEILWNVLILGKQTFCNG